MRESRTYGSGRGACHEMHVPTATETPRVHHAARWCGGSMAARGARAAAGHLGRGYVGEPMGRHFCAATARTRLDRGTDAAGAQSARNAAQNTKE